MVWGLQLGQIGLTQGISSINNPNHRTEDALNCNLTAKGYRANVMIDFTESSIMNGFQNKGCPVHTLMLRWKDCG